jgi:hypothetical protein
VHPSFQGSPHALRGRLWRLHGSPLPDAPTWEKFLAEVPGRPELVIIDLDDGPSGRARAH